MLRRLVYLIGFIKGKLLISWKILLRYIIFPGRRQGNWVGTIVLRRIGLIRVLLVTISIGMCLNCLMDRLKGR